MYVIKCNGTKKGYFLKYSDSGTYMITVVLKSNAMQFKEYDEAEDFIKNNLKFPEEYYIVKV